MAAGGKVIVNAGALTADATSITTTLAVAGATTLTGALNANGGIACDTDAFTVADTSGNTAIKGTLTVTGATVLNGGLTMDTNKFTVADTSGNTVIGGTLAVTGAATLSSTLAAGATTVAGTFGAGTTGAEFTVAADGALAIATDGLTVTAAGAGVFKTTLKSTGDFTVGANKLVVTATSGNILGKGTLGVGTNGTEFTVAASGNTVIAGTLAVTGATTLTGALAANGGFSCDTPAFSVADTSGNTVIGGTLGVAGASTFAGGYGSSGVTISDSGRVSIDENLIVDGTSTLTGAVSAANSVLSSHATGGIGYATGAGGAVSQLTNRTTGVECNKVCGTITTHNASLAAGAEATFTVTNSAVAATDVVVVSLQDKSATALSIPFVTDVAAGTFDITLTNLDASTADTSASKINFVVIKGVTS